MIQFLILHQADLRDDPNHGPGQVRFSKKTREAPLFSEALLLQYKLAKYGGIGIESNVLRAMLPFITGNLGLFRLLIPSNPSYTRKI